MSKTSLSVEVHFTSSKAWSPKLKEVAFDKYKLKSIPTAKQQQDDTQQSLVLEFQDLWEESQVNSNPQREGDYILSFLSLVDAMKVDFNAFKLNTVDLTETLRRRSSFLRGEMDSSIDLGELCRRLKSLDQDLLIQYLRGCSAYRSALSLIEESPTLSLFLLVTAIEAVSHNVVRSGDLRKDFVEFILTYLSKSFEEQLGIELLTKLINEAYNMRCAFTHGGREISIGTLSADNIHRIYVKHKVEGKEVCSPSLAWFASVVQNVLLRFLTLQEAREGRESILSDLAREEAIMQVIAARDIQSGQFVTTRDLDLDFKEKP